MNGILALSGENIMKRILIFVLLIIFMISQISYSDIVLSEYDTEGIFQNHNSVMLIIDSKTGIILDANEAAEKFYGYSKDELLSLKISDINILSDEEINVEMEAALLEQRNYFEFKHQLKNGAIRYVEVYSSPASDKEGNSVLFSIIHDVTEKKIAEYNENKNKMIAIIFLSALAILFFILMIYINRSKNREEQGKLKFKSLFDNMNEGFALHQIILDEHGKPIDYKFLEANDAFEKITGLRVEEIKEKTVKEILPETESYWIESFGEVALTGKSVNVSNYSAGLDKYFNVNAYSPSLNLFATIFTDITMQVKAKEKIEKERKLLEMILEDILSGYWDWNIQKNEVYLSPSFKAMFGHDDYDGASPAETWQKHMLEEDVGLVKEQYKAHIESKGDIPFYNEVRYYHKGGFIVWVIFSGRIVEWDGNKPKRMVGCNVNITKLKELEELLKIERNLFKTTLHSIGDGVISTDIFGRIDIMNAVAENLTGWSNLEARGLDFEDIFNIKDENTGEKCENPIKRVIESGEVTELESNTILIRKDNKEIPIEDSASIIKDESGEVSGVVVVFRDFTEKREKQARIKYLSYHDQLTGLYNRHFFEEELRRLDTKRNLPFTVAMIDVNGLKLTNDAFGHETGDLLLKSVANRLKNECREDDIIARIGGDEFVLLLPRTSENDAEQIVRRIYKAIADEKIENIVTSVSIGFDTKISIEQDIKEVFTKAEDHMYSRKITESQSMRNRTIKVITNTLNDSNPREKIHSQRVSALSKIIGSIMQLDDQMIKDLEVAGLLHDIGKIGVDQQLLRKDGKLTNEEYEEIKKHPELSYQILKSADSYTKLADYVLSHHERWDGKGYPRGLSGEDIPLPARIIVIADAYEAITAERAYRKARSHEEAIEEIIRCSGSHFDPKIVDELVKNSNLLKNISDLEVN